MKKLLVIYLAVSIAFLGGEGFLGFSQAFAASESEASDANVSKSSDKPATPTAAWVIEGLGGVLVVGGFVFMALGWGKVTQRKDLEGKKDQEAVKATEIRALEDDAIWMTTTGYVVAGVGAVAMIIGAIWILSHDPIAKNKASASKANIERAQALNKKSLTKQVPVTTSSRVMFQYSL